MAEESGVCFVPHGWSTAPGLAADLHLAAALPHTDLVEYLIGSPYIDDIAAGRSTPTACCRFPICPASD